MESTFKHRKERLAIFRSLRKTKKSLPKEFPDDLFYTCDGCGSSVDYLALSNNYHVCPTCSYPFKLTASQRLELIVDVDSFKELDAKVETIHSKFVGYEEKLERDKAKTGLKEAAIYGTAKIDTFPCVIAIMDSNFMMGSMGGVVGEKITRAIELATKKKLPLIIVSTSGGARMQEGNTSLMQMAKTSAAIKRHSDAGLLYLSVITHPTTGGVSASFAMLGDIIISEPKALIGFAGKRVVEKTINEVLPEEFQKAEFLLDKGFLDCIVTRDQMKVTLAKLLKFHRR